MREKVMMKILTSRLFGSWILRCSYFRPRYSQNKTTIITGIKASFCFLIISSTLGLFAYSTSKSADIAIPKSKLAGRLPVFSLQNITKITAEQDYIAPEWSPTNPDQIAFSNKRFHGINRIALSDRKVVSLTVDEGSGFKFIWTRDGKHIVYLGKVDDEHLAIKAIEVQSKKITNLSGPSKDIGLPQELPSNVIGYRSEKLTKLKTVLPNLPIKDQPFAYQENDNIFLEIGKKVFQITQGNGKFYLPKVSPDGLKVLYEELSTGIYISNIDGTDAVNIGMGNNPNWSPDSRYIVYDISQDDGHVITASELFISDIRGAEKTQLTSSPNLIKSRPSFSPDGTKITFDANGAIYIADLIKN